MPGALAESHEIVAGTDLGQLRGQGVDIEGVHLSVPLLRRGGRIGQEVHEHTPTGVT